MTFRLTLAAFAVVLLSGAGLHAQSSASLPDAPGMGAPKPTAATAPTRPIATPLKPYLVCTVPAGTTVTDFVPLPEAPMTRTAETIKGARPIKLMDGVGATFAFPQGNFANAKFELLPASTYAAEKLDLLAEWEKILYSGDNTERNYALKATMNGFGIQGFDRKAFDGQVLGIYLLFDDAHHVATTIYFLNQDDKHRNFHNAAEYAQLRDRFIADLTDCVRTKLDAAAKSKPAPITHK